MQCAGCVSFFVPFVCKRLAYTSICKTLMKVSFFFKILGERPVNDFFLIKLLLKEYRKEHYWLDGLRSISPRLLLCLGVICFKCCYSKLEGILFSFAFFLNVIQGMEDR